MLFLHIQMKLFSQRLSCLERNIWICICWNWFISGARKCSLLQGGDLQLPGAASKAGDAGRRESVGKVPRGRTDSQLPPGSFWAQSTPWVVHRSYFTLGTYPAFGNWHVKGVYAGARCENSGQHVMALAAGKPWLVAKQAACRGGNGRHRNIFSKAI